VHTLSDEVFDMDNSVVKVPVADVRVEHEVKMTDFQRWLEGRADRRGKRLTVREFALSSAWSCPGNVSELIYEKDHCGGSGIRTQAAATVRHPRQLSTWFRNTR